MTSRILPPEEWPRLAGTELETSWPQLPRDAQVVVVEDGSRIVACWAVFRIVHVEGAWIAPKYRKRSPRITIGLLRAMQRAARAWGADYVWTGACTDDVRDLIWKLGGKPIPFDCYALPIPALESD